MKYGLGMSLVVLGLSDSFGYGCTALQRPLALQETIISYYHNNWQ